MGVPAASKLYSDVLLTCDNSYLQKDYVHARLEYEMALELEPDNALNLQKLERAAAKEGGASRT